MMLILFAAACFGQANISGFGDTSQVAAFRADSLKYSKWFPLSTYENMNAVVLVNDTSAAGYASDSVKFIWGVQYGDPVLNSSGKLDTTVRQKLIVVDTFFDTSTNFVLGYGSFDSTGTQAAGLKSIDSVNVTGFMAQSRNISPEWHGYVRFFAKGLTKNKVAAFLKIRFAMVRRVYVPVRQQ